jgi:hypothetical protein
VIRRSVEIQWILGDLAAKTPVTYGGREIQQLAETHGVPYDTLCNWRTTARAYAEPERHTGNPFTVYEIFNRWPDRAELVTSQSWTVSEARKLARARSGRAGLRNPDDGSAWAVRDDLIGIHHPCVYRLLDSGGRVIYVGKTTVDLRGPIGRHRRKFWWSEVAGVETLMVPLQALDEREATEIHPAHPKYNDHCPRCGVLLSSRKAV